MIYQVDDKILQKLGEINRLANLLEVKGSANISILYAIFVGLNDTIETIQKGNSITIDTTKEKK